MRAILCLTALALVTSTAARAEEKSEARAIIDKAIKAMGGTEKLAVEKARSFKAKGKVQSGGGALDYTGEFAVQPPDKLRFQMEFEANAMKFTIRYVFDGKQGWMKINDQTMTMDKDAVAEAKESMYAGRVEALVTLVKGKGYDLATVGEVKVGERAAVGVRVSHKGHRDINLFFDKQNGLLLKSERTIKDQEMGYKERTQETVFLDYKKVGDIQVAMKNVINRDGEKYVESELSDLEIKDKIDDAEFAKP
jgi:outer membrane lipoprotein-sorting protein